MHYLYYLAALLLIYNGVPKEPLLDDVKIVFNEDLFLYKTKYVLHPAYLCIFFFAFGRSSFLWDVISLSFVDQLPENLYTIHMNVFFL